MIEISSLARAFETLGHESRLAIVRLLIPAGPTGLPAGAIGSRLGLPASGLSFHLNRLVAAGLIERRRDGRHLYYAVAYAQLARITGFLADDCCAAAPDGCLPECPSGPDERRAAGCGGARSPARATWRKGEPV